jgi:hypothetical protein
MSACVLLNAAKCLLLRDSNVVLCWLQAVVVLPSLDVNRVLRLTIWKQIINGKSTTKILLYIKFWLKDVQPPFALFGMRLGEAFKRHDNTCL